MPGLAASLAAISLKVSVPKLASSRKMPMRKPKSPMRLTTKAFLPALAAVGLLKPEADEQIRRETDALPADEHDEHVAGEDQSGHEEEEEIQVAEVARVAGIVVHVADGVDVDEEANAGDDEQHDKRELVEGKRKVDVEGAEADPVPKVSTVDGKAGAGKSPK